MSPEERGRSWDRLVLWEGHLDLLRLQRKPQFVVTWLNSVLEPFLFEARWRSHMERTKILNLWDKARVGLRYHLRECKWNVSLDLICQESTVFQDKSHNCHYGVNLLNESMTSQIFVMRKANTGIVLLNDLVRGDGINHIMPQQRNNQRPRNSWLWFEFTKNLAEELVGITRWSLNSSQIHEACSLVEH